MSNKISIRRNSDATFVIYLNKESGRPYSLENMTTARLKLPLQSGGALTVSNATTPAVAAQIEYFGITFTAVTAGIIGNSITLTFDALLTVDDVVNAWNTANPSNTVSHDGTGTEVPDAGTATLVNGADEYKKVDVSGNPILGELTVILPEADTAQLRLGTDLNMELVVIKGISPSGETKIVDLLESLDVTESFF